MRRMLLLIGVFLVTLSGVQAQDSNPIRLNEIDAQYKSGNSEKLYYKLNDEYFETSEIRKGSQFEFSTKNGAHLFKVTRRTEYLPGYISITASKVGESENIFIATYKDGSLTGQYHEDHNRTVYLGFEKGSQKNYLSENKPDDSKNLSCGLHDNDLEPDVLKAFSELKTDKRSKTTSENLNFSGYLYDSVEDSITIDLLLAYTDTAATWAESSIYLDINSVIAQAMNLSQTALDNSNLGINLRLVHVYKTEYDGDNSSVSAGDHLRRFTQGSGNANFGEEFNGYMDEVHQKRDQYGADLVGLIMSEPNTGGIAWRLSSTAGRPAYGFSVNRVQQIASGYTLIHEIGHNMGNAHSRTQNQSQADAVGGLFHYSAGYQDIINSFHTIMAYSDGLNRAPIFSGPDLSFMGNPAGNATGKTPENNARSMREIKRVVANYRQSIINPPVIQLSRSNVSIDMIPDSQRDIVIDITNTGQSNLFWHTDFKAGQQAGKRQKSSSADNQRQTTIERVYLEQARREPANHSRENHRFKLQSQTELYGTSFETNEGFDSGTTPTMTEWRALSDSEFNVATVNPSVGGQHIRLSYNGKTNDQNEPEIQFVSSPYFGYLPFGGYEVSVDFAVSDTSDIYDIYTYDTEGNNLSAAVIIANGTIYTASGTGVGESFNATGKMIEEDVYYSLKMVFNPANESLDYYLDGVLLSENAFLIGNTPDVMRVLHRNSVVGSTIDIDNMQITELYTPYSWLSVSKKSGVAFNQDSDQFTVSLNTENLAFGTYETTIRLFNNTVLSPVIEIPIELTVSQTVSNTVDDRPVQMKLNQNYPNPFNPSTTITYTLTEAQTVNMKVYNIQGQKVATLLNDERVNAGTHDIVFDASDLASGVYIYRLETGSKTLTKQMVLIK